MSGEFTPSAAAAAPVATQAIHLEYDTGGGGGGRTPAHLRRRSRVAWLVALLPGLVVPFVPFACDASPLKMLAYGTIELGKGQVMRNDEFAPWLLSMPFFLIFPLVFWKVRRTIGRPSSRVGRRAARVMGNASTAVLIVVMALAARGAASPHEWLSTVVTSAGIALAISLEILLLMRAGARDDAVEMAMLGPYVMTLGFAISAWYSEAKIGWYLSLIPLAGGLAELIATAWFVWRTRARPAESS
jgi:hypothetical protein